MYIPAYSKLNDLPQIFELMRANSFAVLVILGSEGLEAVHIPLLIESEEPLVLYGHVAKANSIWKHFDGTTSALVIFTGPEAYISPSMFVSTPNVPTWNYVAVHAGGKPAIVSVPEQVLGQLREMMTVLDPLLTEKNPEVLEEDFLRHLMPGIVAFTLRVETLTGKQKMSQNKPDADRSQIAKNLLASELQADRETGTWMTTKKEPLLP